MNKQIRNLQMKVLDVFSSIAGGFALAGGTALEMFYFNHRFSKDLDFFARDYDVKEIDAVAKAIEKNISGVKIKPESEFRASTTARVRFYTLSAKKSALPLKIDFVEDVIVNEPEIKKFKGIPVYSINDIYLHKIAAVAGTRTAKDVAGRQIMAGRNEARDYIDLYYLSKKATRLSKFLEKLPAVYQTGMAHWYRTYSRHDFGIAFLDEDVYDKKLNAREIIKHLDDEIKAFIGVTLR